MSRFYIIISCFFCWQFLAVDTPAQAQSAAHTQSTSSRHRASQSQSPTQSRSQAPTQLSLPDRTSLSSGRKLYLNGRLSLDSLTAYLHRHSDIGFSFNSRKIQGDRQISLPAGAYSLEALLKRIHESTGLYYKVYGNHIIFQDNPATPTGSPHSSLSAHSSSARSSSARSSRPGSSASSAHTSPSSALSGNSSTNISARHPVVSSANPSTAIPGRHLAVSSGKPSMINSTPGRNRRTDSSASRANRIGRTNRIDQTNRTDSLAPGRTSPEPASTAGHISTPPHRSTHLLDTRSSGHSSIASIPNISPVAVIPSRPPSPASGIPTIASRGSVFPPPSALIIASPSKGIRNAGSGDGIKRASAPRPIRDHLHQPGSSILHLQTGLFASETLYANAGIEVGIKPIHLLVSWGTTGSINTWRLGLGTLLGQNPDSRWQLQASFCPLSASLKDSGSYGFHISAKGQLYSLSPVWNKQIGSHWALKIGGSLNLLHTTYYLNGSPTPIGPYFPSDKEANGNLYIKPLLPFINTFDRSKPSNIKVWVGISVGIYYNLDFL